MTTSQTGFWRSRERRGQVCNPVLLLGFMASEKVSEESKASLLAEAKSQLERYAEAHGLAKTWHLKPQGTVTLIRLALVFHGEELLFAEEI